MFDGSRIRGRIGGDASVVVWQRASTRHLTSVLCSIPSNVAISSLLYLGNKRRFDSRDDGVALAYFAVCVRYWMTFPVTSLSIYFAMIL